MDPHDSTSAPAANFRSRSEPGPSWLHSRWGTLLAAGLIVSAGLGAYANSFWGPFIYDDLPSIRENPSIRQFWPLGPALSPPCDNRTVTSRPLLNLSLAINYRLGGLKVWGYHATNLAIHLINGLLLLGIVRRTFLLPVLKPRYGDAAWGLALAIALAWTVHPLQTESVTYVIQRAESLAGLFYLLTLYSVVRGSQSSHRTYWYIMAVGICFLGVGVKEIVSTAPVAVLLYDRTFLEDSFGKALRRRWGLYVGLFACWGFQLCLLARTGLPVLKEEVGPIGMLAYARSQLGVILHYLRLSLWPHPLCLSYDWPVAHTLGAILPGALAVGLLGTVTVWGLWKRRGWGFLGAWFFLILAPTSSIMPLPQLAFEHRMYLSLAAVVTLVVVGGFLVGQHLMSTRRITSRMCMVVGMSLAVLAAVGLGFLTFQRNKVYQSPLSIWGDTVAKAPHNPYAQSDLGNALDQAGRSDEAIKHYEEAVRLKPDYAIGHTNLAAALRNSGRVSEAIGHYEEAVRLKPDRAEFRTNLGVALQSLGRLPEAIAHCQAAIRLNPDYADAHTNLGVVLAAAGRLPEAVKHHQEAIRLKPDCAAFHNNLGSGMLAMGRPAEAVEHYQAALRIDPASAETYNNLGNAMVALERTSEAIEHFERAVQIKPGSARALYNLGNTLAQVGRLTEAVKRYEDAVRAEPDYAEAHNNWGAALLRLDRVSDAIEQFRAAIRSQPESPGAQLNLVMMLAQTGKLREAIEQGRKAVVLLPQDVTIHRLVAGLMASHERAEGGDPMQAVELAERACQLTGRRDPGCLDTLAAAYASAERFDEAVATAKEAWQLAQSAGESSLAEEIHVRLQLYRDRKPYREPIAAPAGRRP